MRTRLESAINFAMKIHEGHLDKGSNLDILHAFRVMLKVVNNLKIIAVLHDTVEEGAKVVEGIIKPGQVSCALLWYGETEVFCITDGELSILNALTRKTEETYDYYIGRLQPITPAVMIKIADLEDHLHPDRIANISAGLIKRYTKALEFLSE